MLSRYYSAVTISNMSNGGLTLVAPDRSPRSATRLNRAVLTPLMKKLSGKFSGSLLNPGTNVIYDAIYKWITSPEEYPTLQMGFGGEGGTSWGIAPSGAK